MPAQWFFFFSVSGDAGFEVSFGTPGVDIVPCGELKSTQCANFGLNVFCQMDMELVAYMQNG